MCGPTIVSEADKELIAAYSASYRQVSRSPFGPDDQIGMLNLISPDSMRKVMSDVDGGKVFDLGVDYFLGMPAWIAQGQPVVGLHQGIDEVPSLSSAELWMEAQFDANLIVVAETLRGLQLRMPNAMVLTDLSPKPVQRALEQRRKSRAPAVASVVVASPTALSMNQLLALREALRPLPILSYAGTADTFAKDMQRQSSVWVAHARGPKPPGCGL